MNRLTRTSSCIRTTLLGAAFAGLMLCAPARSPGQAAPAGTPGEARRVDERPADIVSPQLQDIGIDQNLNAELPKDAVFTDDYGQTIRLGDLFGKRPAILVMVYYECPMLCNMVLNDLLRTMNGMKSHTVGEDFDLITVSINPRETPELAAKKKRAYMKEYGQRGNAAGWHFLTGTEENIAKVAKTVGFRYRYDEARKEYIHASGIMTVTTDGRLQRYFYGIDYSPKDLRLSLVEASENKIGTMADAVLLYCFHYDPTTGKYGFQIMAALRLAGIATVLTLGTFMGIMFWRDRRARAFVPRANVGSDESKALEDSGVGKR
jgi:protein SCO1/2